MKLKRQANVISRYKRYCSFFISRPKRVARDVSGIVSHSALQVNCIKIFKQINHDDGLIRVNASILSALVFLLSKTFSTGNTSGYDAYDHFQQVFHKEVLYTLFLLLGRDKPYFFFK